MTGDTPKDDFANRAQAVFEQTALSEGDVEAEVITVAMAKELIDIANFFEGFIRKNYVSQESIAYFENLVLTARLFADILPNDPHKEMAFEDGMKPMYLAVCDLCEDVVQIVENIDMRPEWKEAYKDTCRRLTFFTLILRENPANLIRSV